MVNIRSAPTLWAMRFPKCAAIIVRGRRSPGHQLPTRLATQYPSSLPGARYRSQVEQGSSAGDYKSSGCRTEHVLLGVGGMKAPGVHLHREIAPAALNNAALNNQSPVFHIEAADGARSNRSSMFSAQGASTGKEPAQVCVPRAMASSSGSRRSRGASTSTSRPSPP